MKSLISLTSLRIRKSWLSRKNSYPESRWESLGNQDFPLGFFGIIFEGGDTFPENAEAAVKQISG